MNAYQVLFSVEVVHRYFSEPTRCRLRFDPDAATGNWLARTGCIARAKPNGLSVYFETPSGPAAGRAALALTGEPASLAFTVSALDPEFGLYSDGLAPCETLEPGSAPQLVFNSAKATRTDPATNRWALPSPAVTGGGGLNVRPDFKLLISLVGDLSDAGRAYQIDFNSRATIWKYLLIGDWAGDRPCVVDATQPGAALFEDPFADLDKPPRQENLADGRMAIPVRSTAPIALKERPTRQIQLWSRSEAGVRERMLVSSLPFAAPANFAIETAGDASTLVTEIYVSR